MNLIKAVDEYFIGEDESEIRPYFYGSMAFGILVSLLIIWTVIL